MNSVKLAFSFKRRRSTSTTSASWSSVTRLMRSHKLMNSPQSGPRRTGDVASSRPSLSDPAIHKTLLFLLIKVENAACVISLSAPCMLRSRLACNLLPAEGATQPRRKPESAWVGLLLNYSAGRLRQDLGPAASSHGVIPIPTKSAAQGQCDSPVLPLSPGKSCSARTSSGFWKPLRGYLRRGSSAARAAVRHRLFWKWGCKAVGYRPGAATVDPRAGGICRHDSELRRDDSRRRLGRARKNACVRLQIAAAGPSAGPRGDRDASRMSAQAYRYIQAFQLQGYCNWALSLPVHSCTAPWSSCLGHHAICRPPPTPVFPSRSDV